MPENSWRKLEILQEILVYAATPIITFFLVRRLLQNLSPGGQSTKDHSRRLENILADREAENEYSNEKHFQRERAPLELTSYEQTIASEVLHPQEINVTFDDIGGLDGIISDLQETIIYPLTIPHLYAHSSPLLSAPSGVLLYGPPGCGKTMLAKALARESGASFINVHISTLTEKWYGDSNKLVHAVFSLAKKLAPSIVFIDEIDAVLGTRRSGEHEASGMVKAEFLTLMDGLTTSAKTGILMLGATNRIEDMDEAVLRRMPKRFRIELPDAEQRRRIFKLILRDTKIDKSLDSNGNRRHFDLDYLVKVSAGMSGSDIKESCREAAMAPVREYIQRRKASGQSIRGINPEEMRGLRTEDFFQRGVDSRAKYRRSSRSMEPEDADYETTDDDGSSMESASPNGDVVHVSDERLAAAVSEAQKHFQDVDEYRTASTTT